MLRRIHPQSVYSGSSTTSSWPFVCPHLQVRCRRSTMVPPYRSSRPSDKERCILGPMKNVAVAVIGLSLSFLGGCDEKDKKAELLSKTGSSATAPAALSAVPKMAESASAPAAKAPKDCSGDPVLEPDIEA